MRRMPKSDRPDFRRVGTVPAEPLPPFAQTFRGRVVLVLLCVGLLTLAYAPFKQFYCAWVGLAPWLVLVGNAPTKKSAFFWSWVTGIVFFSVNLWWIGYVTVPGAMGLMLYMGVWFALNAMVIRGVGLLEVGDAAKPQAAWRPVGAIMLIAATWVAQEWIRGNLFTGLPWLYVGHTQTPVLAMCQIADLTSVYGVTFWVVMVNAWVALFVLHRLNPARLVVAGVVLVGLLGVVLGYGLFRMGQRTSYPGPTVLVVQPNYPQSNSGAKGATLDEIMDFHVNTTVDYMKKLPPGGRKPDLVAWSETMLPELNPDYRRYAYNLVFKEDGRIVGEYLDRVSEALGRIARTYDTSLIVGAHTTLADREVGGKPQWRRQRNSAYYYERTGEQSRLRYDKIHLVPFGEFMPFRESFPLLFQFFNLFNPYKEGEYTVEAGSELTVFPLPVKPSVATTGPTTAPSLPAGQPSTEARELKFVTAICFEDVDSRLMARALAAPDGGKRADFIVNLTNDGWFAFNQMPQHLQLSVFRCIENRVPIARSVNTGISGFIDPVGRVYDEIPVHTTGARASALTLDRRVAPYTHLGDVFAAICLTVSGGAAVAGAWLGVKNRRAARR